MFYKKRSYFQHININNLLSKIEKIRFIAKASKATKTGISKTIFDAEIYIEGYCILRCDRDRKGGGVACYIKHNICFSTKHILSKNNILSKNIMLLPKTKLISVAIVYRPPKNTRFLQLFTEI